MIFTTSGLIHGKKIKETLGLVQGNTIQARWVGRDILAGLKQIIGGEIKSYTQLLTKARELAIKRMIIEAEKMEADAIVDVRFTTSAVMAGAAELLAYGTAVKLEK